MTPDPLYNIFIILRKKTLAVLNINLLNENNLDFLQSTSQIIIYNNSKTQKCGLITPIHATKRK
jgi:hypothetical protein